VKAYVAHEKYAAVTAAMNWGGASVGERVDILIAKIVELLEACHLPTSIRAAGIAPAEFEAAIPELVRAACDDISLRSNPRMPLLHELQELLHRAYAGPPG